MQTVCNSQHYSSQAVMPPDAISLMERYAFEHGQTYDSYLVTETDREYFWSSGRRGVIGFRRWHRYAHILGGLLTAPEHRETLLVEFLEYMRANRLRATFFNLGRDDLALFRRHEFQTCKFGEEPIVRLDRTCWQGKPYQWVRRQENYCMRQGVRFEELATDPADTRFRERILPQLEEINRDHLPRTLHGRELEFFQGQFDPNSLLRRRLFAAWHNRRIVAFIVCNPGLGGNLWAIEMYRRRPDAPRGIIPFSMLQVMRKLKDEGVDYCSLSLVPFVRCWPPVNSETVMLPFVCGFWWRRMNWLFDARGIYHYKSRFRPYYREMFVATHPRVSCASMIAAAATWKLFRVNPLRLAGRALNMHRHATQRQTLAKSEWRPERVIRELTPNRKQEPPTTQPTKTP